MDPRSRRQVLRILLIVGVIVGLAVPHFGFSSGAEEITVLAIIAVVVFLVSAVLGRGMPGHVIRLPWAHVLGATGLFVGAVVLGYIVSGRFAFLLKGWIALLIVVGGLLLILYRNLWPARRPGSGASGRASNPRG